MRVYLFFKIAMVFLALDSCGGCEPEDLFDVECQNRKAEIIDEWENAAEFDRQKARDNEELSEEEREEIIAQINLEYEEKKQRVILSPCN